MPLQPCSLARFPFCHGSQYYQDLYSHTPPYGARNKGSRNGTTRTKELCGLDRYCLNYLCQLRSSDSKINLLRRVTSITSYKLKDVSNFNLSDQIYRHKEISNSAPVPNIQQLIYKFWSREILRNYIVQLNQFQNFNESKMTEVESIVKPLLIIIISKKTKHIYQFWAVTFRDSFRSFKDISCTMLVYSYPRLFLLTLVLITMAKIYIVILVRQEIQRRMPVPTSYSSFSYLDLSCSSK